MASQSTQKPKAPVAPAIPAVPAAPVVTSQPWAAPETAASETAAPETAASETAAPETTASETTAPETAASEEGKVIVTIPKGFNLLLDNGELLKFKAGIDSVTLEVANHWYSKANGMTIFKPE